MRARQIGDLGEKAACTFLKKSGYKILEKNYLKPMGEIDIIAQKGEYISFIEVKTRQSDAFGLPCEAVTKAKQQRIIKTAYAYIAEQNLDASYSFDIIEVFHDGKKAVNIRHLPFAFSALG